ncbi:MAG TPA: hypothetical protein VK680_09165 [Solirubrobacteraceae bacterium]|nr:hypothetical protein [Solirubrobacteraceae bacterium]
MRTTGKLISTPPRPTTRRLMGVLSALTVVLSLAGSPTTTTAQGAPSLSWSAPATFDAGKVPSALSCASEFLCVAVDHQGDALSTSDPATPTPSWNTAEPDHGEAFTAVSCAPAGPCVAVDDRGYASVGFKSGAATWSVPAPIDAGKVLTGVSCPSASLCVAVDDSGNLLTNSSPGSGSWQSAIIDPEHPSLTSVSCASSSSCVAVDAYGDVLTSADPNGGSSAWHLQRIDAAELNSVSCSVAGACVAVDGRGQALASADPTAVPATWSVTPIDAEPLTNVSCAASGLCVAIDAHGEALASDDPASPTPAWSSSSADSESPAGISCLASGFCLVVDTGGHSAAARVPAPTLTTLSPTEVSATAAVLAGVVEPNDSALTACSFEVGNGGTGPYDEAIPCALLPVALSGEQAVSAQLSGLAPNTTYHYRVLASSPSGTSVGGAQMFTTPTSTQVALVHPNPSIAGTPGNGQQLTCHANLPAGASAQLSYGWLRDLIPIAGANASTYTVKGQDTGHHLQCKVTATNGGGSFTANSSFVTIPVGGVPASAGETTVGKAIFKGGRLSVPLACSTRADSGCDVTLRLVAVETLSGHRIVAVAARSSARAYKSSSALRHTTVTLASAHVHLARGAYQTVLVTLSSAGRRVLHALHHFSAYVYAKGTVIGVIQAQLSQQLITLSASAHSASTHVARHR